MMIKLSSSSLGSVHSSIPRPLYNREAVKPAIVHVGVGGFHRTHQAVYLQALLNEGITNWGICGMGIKPADERIYKALKSQDHLYTVIEKHPDGTIQPLVIGSIIDFIYAPEDHANAIEKLADPQTKILSLTITEGGYNLDEAGEFMIDQPDVQWDLKNPDEPKTIFGLMASALKLRMERNIPAFTVLSCDNIQNNGMVTKKMLLSFTDALDKNLSAWINEHVTFPNSMVDRITPATTGADIELLKNKFSINDAWPITCEPFIQWVMEDEFCNGRPAWEKAGVQFVKHIEPYEKMKLRLLNAGHSLIGMLGVLYDYQTIDEAVSDAEIQQLFRSFMAVEVTPTLDPVENIDLAAYQEKLVERFSNPTIKDQLSRICMESSAKLPRFLIPTINEQLAAGGPVERSALVIAAWCHILENYDSLPEHNKFPDAMLDELIRAAKDSTHLNELNFIRIQTIFGDLTENARFATIYSKIINDIRVNGISHAVKTILQ